MNHYAIGDIQGCDAAFARLLERLSFDPGRDRLWLVGDLVNRGPGSLAVLRRVISLGPAVQSVLGNHDLHLLAVAAGARRLNRNDTFADVLNAPDSSSLLDWLRRQPLLIHDPACEALLVHAGIPPAWSLKRALKEAEFAQSLLRGDAWQSAMGTMYGNAPRRWSKKLNDQERFRFAINAMTRMRFCDAEGRLTMRYSGPPGTQPKRFFPWFDVPGRKLTETRIFFGHWSALGVVEGPGYTALDSGCVWGRKLTAVNVQAAGHRPRMRVRCRD